MSEKTERNIDKNDNKGGWIESLGMACISAAFFIAWGLWVNWEHGVTARVQVACTQGLVSFASTFVSAEVIKAISLRVGGSQVRRVFLGGGSSYVAIYGVIGVVHFIAGTPELWQTMLPGLVIGVFFCFGYALRVTHL